MDQQKKWIIAGAALVVGVLIIWGWRAQPETEPEAAVSQDVTAEDWIQGKETARMTLVEYTDFECPACGAYYPVVKQLMENYPDDLRVVIRHYPLLQIHKNA